MGANNHVTTQPDDVNMTVKRQRLINDLQGMPGVENVRSGMFAESCVIVETDGAGLRANVLRTLAEHNARVSDNKGHDDPFEVFIE